MPTGVRREQLKTATTEASYDSEFSKADHPAILDRICWSVPSASIQTSLKAADFSVGKG